MRRYRARRSRIRPVVKHVYACTCISLAMERQISTELNNNFIEFSSHFLRRVIKKSKLLCRLIDGIEHVEIDKMLSLVKIQI